MFDVFLVGPFEDNLGRLERWTINPTTRRASIDVIDATPQEFPRRPRRPHRPAVPLRLRRRRRPVQAEWPTLKHDLQTGERWTFDHGPGRAAGEPVFVGRQGGTAEDDGWLMTFVHDIPNETAELVVLDAQDFDRGYVAQVPLPQRVPFGFHGNWVSDRSVPGR